MKNIGSGPGEVFDSGLQQERTALSWERTAVAMMVAGALLARYGASTQHPAFALLGIGQVLVGAGLLVWAGVHYAELHGPLRRGESPVHPQAVKITGLCTMTATAVAVVLAGVIAAS